MTTRKERFVSALKTKSPDFKIAFKNESLLMKILRYVLFFNPSFMNGYVTTIGSTIYFPSKVRFELSPEFSTLMTLAHEYQHVKDAEKYGILFYLGYLFPLCLLPLALVTFFFFPWWISLIMCLVTLAPWPAPWRKYFEHRGYTMSLYVWNKLADENKMAVNDKIRLLSNDAKRYEKKFTSFDYYLMWPFGVNFDNQIDAIITGDIDKTDDIFGEVSEALKSSK